MNDYANAIYLNRCNWSLRKLCEPILRQVVSGKLHSRMVSPMALRVELTSRSKIMTT